MKLHSIAACILPFSFRRKLGERLKQQKANCFCLCIIFSVAWYGYVASLLLLNGRILGFNISNSSAAMNKIGTILVDATKFGRHVKQRTDIIDAAKRERVLHEIEKCFKIANCSGKDAGKSCIVDNKERKFECSHVMILGNRNLGRTGNQMFQVAALLGIASFHGYTPIVDPSMSITSWFDLPNVSRIKLGYTTRLSERRCCMYDGKAVNLSHAFNWTLHGYFQSWRYFEGAEHIIRRAFKINNKYANEAADFIKAAVADNVVKIGVHVRRGDFTAASSQVKGYSLAPLKFIKKAMTYFRKKYNQVHFFIVSDDKMWCDRNLRGINITVAPTAKLVGFDMALLTQCNHAIVTSGSFGWWGAWISGGDVVYWKGFPGNSTWLAKQTRREDYYPSTWIGLP